MKINFLNGLYEERCDVHEFHERPLCEKMQLKQKDLVFFVSDLKPLPSPYNTSYIKNKDSKY